MVARHRARRGRGARVEWDGSSAWDNGQVLRCMVLTVTVYCECTQCHRLVHSRTEMAGGRFCRFYHNKKRVDGKQTGLPLLILHGSADAQASAWPLGPAQGAQMHLVPSDYSSNSALCTNQVKATEQHFFFQLLRNREVSQPSVLGGSVYFPSQRIPSCSGKR